MKTVARVIGHKPGTGGSSGVNYLVKALSLSFFPELWSMRTEMVPPREGGDYAGGPRAGDGTGTFSSRSTPRCGCGRGGRPSRCPERRRSARGDSEKRGVEGKSEASLEDI